MKFLTVSWKTFENKIHRLATNISSSEKDLEIMVAIARGGMSVAHILSDFLHLPIATFTISSYKDLKQTKMSQISYGVGGSLQDKKILLVDDISDTGNTFIRGIEHIKEMGGASIVTASVFIKTWTSFVPDYYIAKTDRWIVQPFEIRETIQDLSKLMKKEGATKEKIREKLRTLKMPEKYIDLYMTK